MTVSVTRWLKLAEVAVIDAAYVPAGVPFDAVEGGGVDDEFPPPQPSIRKTKTISGPGRASAAQLEGPCLKHVSDSFGNQAHRAIARFADCVCEVGALVG